MKKITEISKEEIEQITKDHSLIELSNKIIQTGSIRLEQARLRDCCGKPGVEMDAAGKRQIDCLALELLL